MTIRDQAAVGRTHDWDEAGKSEKGWGYVGEKLTSYARGQVSPTRDRMMSCSTSGYLQERFKRDSGMEGGGDVDAASIAEEMIGDVQADGRWVNSTAMMS